MHVEFFGIPRERAGVAEIEVDARTLGQLLSTLEARFPAMRELITSGRLNASIAANLNGEAFISDPDTALTRDDRVLLISADAGG